MKNVKFSMAQSKSKKKIFIEHYFKNNTSRKSFKAILD